MPLFLKYSKLIFNYKSETRKFTSDEKTPSPKIIQCMTAMKREHAVQRRECSGRLLWTYLGPERLGSFLTSEETIILQRTLFSSKSVNHYQNAAVLKDDAFGSNWFKMFLMYRLLLFLRFKSFNETRLYRWVLLTNPNTSSTISSCIPFLAYFPYFENKIKVRLCDIQCLKQTLQNLVCISWYLRLSQCRTLKIPPITLCIRMCIPYRF
jgi:hypothetical protein